ncbi:hypothetical protein ACX8Z9_06160 [Arthrobacter halodurans]|uniref:Uncharacterized protein n=1 Tax=Arthrobacter halodurans TaxID=516699 RepID=A0ABV4UMF8_9MICC
MAGHVLGIDGRAPRLPAGAWVAPTVVGAGSPTETEPARCLANAETHRTLTALHAEASGGATLASVTTRPNGELP